jgi:tetratricopeptide (TPR) repeat protein
MMDSEREKEFLEVLKVFPDDAMTRFGLANFYRDSGRTAEAVDQYRKIIEIDPGYGAAYLELGDLLVKTGDRTGAREIYRQAIATAEKKGDTHIKNRAEMRLEDLN